VEDHRWPPLDWLLSLGNEALIGLPLLLLFLLIITFVELRVCNLLVDNSTNRWAKEQTNPRLQQRAPTITNAIKGWLRALFFVVLGVVLIYQFNQLRSCTRTVAIIAGFLSCADSLASQSLLKDLITGLFISSEDQYGAGDVVTIGNYDGLVEEVGLRITKPRSLDGKLITILNRSIDAVRKLSSEWSRVNDAIDFNFDVDVDR
jgi:small-conductance mechanosensitive channel